MRPAVISLKNVGIISQGVDSIADGRLFFLELPAADGKIILPQELRDLRPLTLKQVEIEYDGKPVEILGPVNEESPLYCPECRRIYQRQLAFHTDLWMCCVLYCPKHPLKVLVDLFLKYAAGTTHCWRNAFKGFGTPTEPKGVEITDYQRPDEHYLEMKRTIQPSFLLTPEGLVWLQPER